METSRMELPLFSETNVPLLSGKSVVTRGTCPAPGVGMTPNDAVKADTD